MFGADPGIHRRPVGAALGHQRGVAVHQHLQRAVAKGGQRCGLVGRGVGQQAEGLVGLSGEDDMVEDLLAAGALYEHQPASIGMARRCGRARPAPDGQHASAALHPRDAGQQLRGHRIGAIAGPSHALPRHARDGVAGDHVRGIGPRVLGAAGGDGGDGRQQQAVHELGGDALGSDELADARASQPPSQTPTGQRRAGPGPEAQRPLHDAQPAHAGHVLRQHILRKQGAAKGAALFARGEGIFWGKGELFFACTNGGAAKYGQIFRYVPSANEGSLREAEAPGVIDLFMESTNPAFYNYGDNIAVMPTGHLLVCEDQYTDISNNHLRGVTAKGRTYMIARSRVQTEFAGGCFSPDGSTMFVNMMEPTMTLAIKGPWGRVKSA